MRGLLAAFIVVSAITAAMVYNFVYGFVTGDIFPTPPVDLGTPKPGETPVPGNPNPQGPAPEVALEPWDGASRVNILVMGLDLRDWESGNGPPRTDTMILLTIDPASKTAGILSIPRDLWVEIPGFEHARINTAYQLGEASQLPGRGPGLAVKTVEKFLGIKINYYAQIDFDAFVKFIDLIGGVKIDVPETIKVDIIGDDHPKKIKRGTHTLDGATALAYARARYTEGGDFDRSQRQQQVIFAIRSQLLRADTQRMVMSNALQIYQDLSSGIQTNLTFDEAFKLGVLAQQIDLEKIQRGAIAPPEYVTLGKSPDGTQDILKPITEKIRLLRDDIFFASTFTSPAVQNMSPAERMQAEGARVAVYNGTPTGGLAGKAQEYLVSLGVNVVEVGNTDQEPYTKIIDYTGKPYTLQFLVDAFKIQMTKIFHSYDPNGAFDIVIIIGPDWSPP